jgi:excisionase family DNA binding protein
MCDGMRPETAQVVAALERDRAERLNGSIYLVVAEVAARRRVSRRTIHELTRRNAIPLVQIGGTRKILFPVDEFELWDRGEYDDLIVEDLPNGGRRVRLVRSNGNGRYA